MWATGEFAVPPHLRRPYTVGLLPCSARECLRSPRRTPPSQHRGRFSVLRQPATTRLRRRIAANPRGQGMVTSRELFAEGPSSSLPTASAVIVTACEGTVFGRTTFMSAEKDAVTSLQVTRVADFTLQPTSPLPDAPFLPPTKWIPPFPVWVPLRSNRTTSLVSGTPLTVARSVLVAPLVLWTFRLSSTTSTRGFGVNLADTVLFSGSVSVKSSGTVAVIETSVGCSGSSGRSVKLTGPSAGFSHSRVPSVRSHPVGTGVVKVASPVRL